MTIGTLKSIGELTGVPLPWGPLARRAQWPSTFPQSSSGIDLFGVYFPDLRGCASTSRIIQVAALRAQEALGGDPAVIADHRDPDLPHPTSPPSRLKVPTSWAVFWCKLPWKKVFLASIDAATGNRLRLLAAAAREKLSCLTPLSALRQIQDSTLGQSRASDCSHSNAISNWVL